MTPYDDEPEEGELSVADGFAAVFLALLGVVVVVPGLIALGGMILAIGADILRWFR